MSFNTGGILFCNSFDDPSHDPHLYPSETGGAANLSFNYNNLIQINTIACSNITGIGSGLTGLTVSQIPALPYLQHRTLWTSPPVSTPSSSLGYSSVSYTSTATKTYQLSVPFYYHSATDIYARFYFGMYLYSPYNNASSYATLSFSIYQSSGPSAPSAVSGGAVSCSLISGASGTSPLALNLSTLGISDGLYYLVISDQITISGKTSPMIYVLTDAEMIVSGI